jgi:hypothetical protein
MAAKPSLFLLQLSPRSPCGFSDSGIGALESGLFCLEQDDRRVAREFLVAAGETELKQNARLMLVSLVDGLAKESHGVAGVV